MNVDYSWEGQQAAYSLVREGGASELAGWPKAFVSVGQPCLCCMDEGICKAGAYRAAGSLLGLPVEEARAFCEETGVRDISSHEGCGAAGILFKKKLEGEGRSLDEATPEAVDAFAVEETKKLVQALGDGYRYAGHVPLADMQRPADRHIARIAYYNASARPFNPSAVSGLPAGFVIDRKGGDAETYVSQVRLAMNIAVGAHGWGDRISAEQPFIVLAIADSENTLAAAERELAPLGPEFAGKLEVRGALAA